jgi:signal-transduction protein with cAMP-binding, CBS, and nucleotidyltransferase domain
MGKLSVAKIVVPVEKDLLSEPFVRSDDRITDALEVMLKNDLRRIAVKKDGEICGMIRLEDALKQVGLEGNLNKDETQSVVIHGRKIVVD